MEALVPEWAALWQRVPHATPFQSPYWLMPWWWQFGTGMPRIITARAGGTLIGVLPLYEYHEADCIKLLPLGISVSDYIDALCDPAYPEVADALLAAVADIPSWQECCLPDLPPDAALESASVPAGLTETCHSGPACPVRLLPPGDAGPVMVVPRKTLRNVRQARARSEDVGAVVIETADLSDIDAALDDLFRLHEKRWQERGEEGVLADPAVRAFHRDAARLLAPGGALVILNYSYRGDLDTDGRDVADVAQRYGFAVERNGTRDFTLWDGVSFLLRKQVGISTPPRRG